MVVKCTTFAVFCYPLVKPRFRIDESRYVRGQEFARYSLVGYLQRLLLRVAHSRLRSKRHRVTSPSIAISSDLDDASFRLKASHDYPDSKW